MIAKIVYCEAVLSIISFVLMRVDKRKATKSKWRIPEKMLIFFNILGPIGAEIAMNFKFINGRHKNNKWYFQVTAFLALLLHGGIIYILLYNPYGWTFLTIS